VRRTLWIFSHYVAIPPAPGGIRHISLASQLTALGWDVCIIRATKEPIGRNGRLGLLPPRRLDTYRGTRIVSLRVPTYQGNGVGRIANMVAFGAGGCLPVATAALPVPDVVVGSTVHPLAAWCGAVQAARLDVPFVFEIRDLWPETFVRLGRLGAGAPAARALYALEACLWQRADLILSPLGQLSEYASVRDLPTRTIGHIPNGVDTAQFDPAAAPHEGPLRIGYFGSHGNTDYLEVIIEALGRDELRERAGEFTVHLYGDGPRKPRLRELARRLRVANVHFHDTLGRDVVPTAMQAMDAFVLPLADAAGLYRFGASPNKLQEYMAAGRPILLNAPFADDPVSLSGGGFVVPDCTPQAWVGSINALLATTQDDRTRMGRQLRRLAEQRYDFGILGRELDRALRSVAKP
jgi:glycosyltransferase involved in cell wall biosynthesis